MKFKMDFLKVGLAALLISTASTSIAGPIIGYSVLGNGTTNPIGGQDKLYSIDLNTGIATAIGLTGFADIDGLAFKPGTSTLYGIDERTNVLVTLDITTGIGTSVGALGHQASDGALVFTQSGELYWGDERRGLFSVDILSGAATSILGGALDITGLTARGEQLFAVRDNSNTLITIDKTNGAISNIGSLGVNFQDDAGLSFDSTGTLWSLADTNDNTGGLIYKLNTATGAASLVANVSCTGVCEDFDSLAIMRVPEPSSLAVFALGILGVGFSIKKKAAKS
jgi:hypothetical protein